ncbi:MAG: gamma-glutamyltransferase, partial [Balneolaceae bacterium]
MTLRLSLYKAFPLLLAMVSVALAKPDHATAQIGWAEPWRDAVVVTAEERATNAGLEILEQGGNAVDAAVAVQFSLAVTLPRAGNIGGGGFMVVHMADGTRAALDFREKAPAKAHRDMFLDPNGEYVPERSRRGPLASGVPGVVAGMTQALERFGTMPLNQVLQPAIRLAREGYPLSHTQASELNSAAGSLSEFEASREYFVRSDGREWAKGDLFVQEELARTLERIAKDGREGFYGGETARLIADQMKRTGGWITEEDLANYHAQWRVPVQSRWNGYELLMMPPPSSGGIVVKQILGMSDSFDLASMGHNSADYIHTLSEIMRRSFADRNHYLGDPDFSEIPLDYLGRDTYLQDRMSSFDPDHASTSDEITHGDPYPVNESDETTHYSILDGEGSAVSITTTLNGSFGSMMSVAGAGFLLNNEMDDFTSKPGEANMFGLV